jgi:hypothetical protein
VILEAEALYRLCRIFFPEMSVPVHWCARLADVFAACDVDEVDVVAYFQALSVHDASGVSTNRAVHDSLRTSYGPLRQFGTAITLVVQATDSERWLEPMLALYEDIAAAVCFVVDGRTSPGTRRLLLDKDVRCVEIGDATAGGWSKATLEQVGTEWILVARDDEIPSPALLAFADRAAEYSPKFVWGFPRVHCGYDSVSDELRYSQFLPFGPLAKASLQWRLVARGDGLKERRAAAADAVLFNFDWIARRFAERVGHLRKCAQDDEAQMTLASFELLEGIPETWHMWTCLREERFEEIARLMHRSRRD